MSYSSGSRKLRAFLAPSLRSRSPKPMTPLDERDPPAADVTHDSLFGGALSIRQPARRTGYRVNVDAILLAAFAARDLASGAVLDAAHRPARHAVDLGSGVGGVGLTLLHLGGASRVTMVEIDPLLASLATVNAEANGWAKCIDVVHADVERASAELAATADLVVCNPPYVTPGRGRVPSERVRSAKYGDLGAFASAARRVAGRRARACFVYPALEAMTLLSALRERGLEPKRLRAVHGRASDTARVVLVESVAGKPGGLVIEPPFIETDARGQRTPELAALLASPRR